jgi:putative endonuclease
MKSRKREFGDIGEDIACRFLIEHGFRVLERNYLKKYGEIDIVGIKKKKLHFIEVKTVSRENIENVNHETFDTHRPEDNVHSFKLQRLGRVIQSYLIDKKVKEDVRWQVDVITVYFDRKNKVARVKILEDIIL